MCQNHLIYMERAIVGQCRKFSLVLVAREHSKTEKVFGNTRPGFCEIVIMIREFQILYNRKQLHIAWNCFLSLFHHTCNNQKLLIIEYLKLSGKPSFICFYTDEVRAGRQACQSN